MKEPIDATTYRNLLDDRDSWRTKARAAESALAALSPAAPQLTPAENELMARIDIIGDDNSKEAREYDLETARILHRVVPTLFAAARALDAVESPHTPQPVACLLPTFREDAACDECVKAGRCLGRRYAAAPAAPSAQPVALDDVQCITIAWKRMGNRNPSKLELACIRAGWAACALGRFPPPSAPSSADDLPARLREVMDRIGRMCADGRCPSMSVPVRPEDDDIFICETVKATISAIDSLTAALARSESALHDQRYQHATELKRAERAEEALRAATEDAERYRFIREGRSGTYNRILVHAGAALDERIDRARKGMTT